MTNTVHFDTAVGGDGSTVTDDDNASTGLANGGFRTRLLPMFTNVVNIALNALASATAAAASALTAVNAPGTSATSTTSVAVGTGSKTLVIQTGKNIVVGMAVMVAETAAPATNWMHGFVTAYNSGTGSLTVDVDATAGSGTYTDWTISLSAPGSASLAAGTTNVYAGTQDYSNHQLKGVKTLTFNGEYDAGNSGAAITIDFAANGQKQKVTLNSATPAITISTTGLLVGQYQLHIYQDGTGGRVPTFSGISSARWIGNSTTPSILSAASAETFINLFYDGSQFTQSMGHVGAV